MRIIRYLFLQGSVLDELIGFGRIMRKFTYSLLFIQAIAAVVTGGVFLISGAHDHFVASRSEKCTKEIVKLARPSFASEFQSDYKTFVEYLEYRYLKDLEGRSTAQIKDIENWFKGVGLNKDELRAISRGDFDSVSGERLLQLAELVKQKDHGILLYFIEKLCQVEFSEFHNGNEFSSASGRPTFKKTWEHFELFTDRTNFYNRFSFILFLFSIGAFFLTTFGFRWLLWIFT